MASILLGRSAFADEVVLRYDRGVESCPDEHALKAMVRASLGRDPFGDEAVRSIEAWISSIEGGLEARIVVREGGEVTGERTLSDPDPGCEELARAVALAISVAIDPLIFRRRIDPPVTSSVAAPVPPAPPPSVPPEIAPATEVRSTEIRAGFGVHAGYGTVPSLTGSLRLGGRLGWPSFTLGVELRFDLPRDVRVAGRNDVSVWLAAASALACYRYEWFSACGVGAAGAAGAKLAGVFLAGAIAGGLGHALVSEPKREIVEVPVPVEVVREVIVEKPIAVDAGAKAIAVDAGAKPFTLSKKPPKSDLAEERALLEQARTALARQNASAALIALADHRTRFAEGRLREERIALEVQALVSTDRRPEAEARAAELARDFPKSMFLPVVEAALQK